MLENLPRSRRNLALALLALVLVFFAWKIRAVINPLLLGYLLAFILQPGVRALTARGFKRTGAVATVFGVAFLAATLLGLGIFFQGRALVRDVITNDAAVAEASAAAADAPQRGEPAAPDEGPPAADGAGADASDSSATGEAEEAGETGETEETGVQSLERLRDWAAAVVGEEWVPDTVPSQRELVETLSVLATRNEGAMQAAGQVGARAAGSIFAYVQRFFGGVFGLSSLALLVPIYAFFWLFELERLNDYIASRIPRRHRSRMTQMFGKLGEVLSVFLRGRLLVSLLKGLFLTVALALAGVPYALLLGLGGGLLSIVPFLGGLLAFVFALVVALSSHGLAYALVVTTAIFVAAELLEGYVLMPRILGDSLGLSDVTVLFALTAGGAALGLMGVLIALPLAAVCKIVWLEFVEPALDQFAEEESEFRAG